MALIQINYLSRALFRTVPVHVILPVDKVSFDQGGYQMRPGQRFKTLVLLHGLLGNYTDWVSGTRIQRWAEERDLAVIMPSGDNAFYVDSPLPNNNYQQFVGQELLQVMRNMFPLPHRREDTCSTRRPSAASSACPARWAGPGRTGSPLPSDRTGTAWRSMSGSGSGSPRGRRRCRRSIWRAAPGMGCWPPTGSSGTRSSRTACP